MKIDFKHRSNLYLNCNILQSVAWSLVKLKTELDRSYSIECDHHIDHNETYYTISERTDKLFIFC